MVIGGGWQRHPMHQISVHHIMNDGSCHACIIRMMGYIGRVQVRR